jgi:hypothetical protein
MTSLTKIDLMILGGYVVAFGAMFALWWHFRRKRRKKQPFPQSRIEVSLSIERVYYTRDMLGGKRTLYIDITKLTADQKRELEALELRLINLAETASEESKIDLKVKGVGSESAGLSAP